MSDQSQHWPPLECIHREHCPRINIAIGKTCLLHRILNPEYGHLTFLNSHTLHFTYFCNFTKSFCNLCGRLVWIWAGRSSDFLGTCLCIFTIFCISTESFCNLCGRLVSRGHPLIQSPPQKKPLPPFFAPVHLWDIWSDLFLHICTFTHSLCNLFGGEVLSHPLILRHTYTFFSQFFIATRVYVPNGPCARGIWIRYLFKPPYTPKSTFIHPQKHLSLQIPR